MVGAGRGAAGTNASPGLLPRESKTTLTTPMEFKSTNDSTLASFVSCPVAFSTKTILPTGTPGTNGASPELPRDKSTSPTDKSAAALNI